MKDNTIRYENMNNTIKVTYFDACNMCWNTFGKHPHRNIGKTFYWCFLHVPKNVILLLHNQIVNTKNGEGLCTQDLLNFQYLEPWEECGSSNF